jgi:hypothetical protein
LITESFELIIYNVLFKMRQSFELVMIVVLLILKDIHSYFVCLENYIFHGTAIFLFVYYPIMLPVDVEVKDHRQHLFLLLLEGGSLLKIDKKIILTMKVRFSKGSCFVRNLCVPLSCLLPQSSVDRPCTFLR